MRQSHIAIIGAPVDLGQDRRGVDMGPSALRVANLNRRIASLGYAVEDMGNVHTDQAESSPTGNEHAKYLDQIANACSKLAAMVGQALSRGSFHPAPGRDYRDRI
jgi:arginase